MAVRRLPQTDVPLESFSWVDVSVADVRAMCPILPVLCVIAALYECRITSPAVVLLKTLVVVDTTESHCLS